MDLFNYLRGLCSYKKQQSLCVTFATQCGGQGVLLGNDTINNWVVAVPSQTIGMHKALKELAKCKWSQPTYVNAQDN